MKKFCKIVLALVMTCVSIASIPLYASTTYEIETKYGTRKLVIPDGYTEQEALLIIAKSYYEQNEEYKELQNKVEGLTDSVEEYVVENQTLREEYDDLLNTYDILIKKYKALSSTKWLKGYLGGEIDFASNMNVDGFQFKVGGLLFEKALITGGVSYSTGINFKESFGLSLGVGFVF